MPEIDDRAPVAAMARQLRHFLRAIEQHDAVPWLDRSRLIGPLQDGVATLRRLQRLRVCVVGVGRLGSLIAAGLATMGVAAELIDPDLVESSDVSKTPSLSPLDFGKFRSVAIAEEINSRRGAALLTAHPVSPMQTKRIAPALFAAALTLTATAGDLPQPAPNTGLASVIIDDQSGDELARDHGIEPLIVPDLLELIKAVLEANRPASLMHLPVDEDSTDNPVGRLTFAPFAGGSPPHAPSPTLPLRVLTAETAKYQRDRAAWQQRIKLYQQKIIADAEGFVRQVTATQFEISERFDAKLAERHGHDYSRSDIVGCISCAMTHASACSIAIVPARTQGSLIGIPMDHGTPQDEPTFDRASPNAWRRVS